MASDKQVKYVCKPASEIAAVDERRQLAEVSFEPLRPFPSIRYDGEIGLAHDKVLLASRPGKATPWGTFRIASATCLHSALIVATDQRELVRETWTTPKALRRVEEFSTIKRDRLPELVAGTPFRAPKLTSILKLKGDYVLASSAPQGFFHWLIEFVPNVALLRDAGREAKLLVPELQFSWQRETLAFAGVRPDQIVEMRQHVHIAGELTFADRLMPNECHISPSIVPFFKALRRKARGPWPRRLFGARRRKLFISRAKAENRRLVNETALLERLEPLGFERIEAKSYSYADQARLFASASIIIGPHGAGLANMVFSPRDTIVIELNYATFRSTAGVTSFAALAELFELKYGLVEGKAVHSCFRRPSRRASPARRGIRTLGQARCGDPHAGGATKQLSGGGAQARSPSADW